MGPIFVWVTKVVPGCAESNANCLWAQKCQGASVVYEESSRSLILRTSMIRTFPHCEDARNLDNAGMWENDKALTIKAGSLETITVRVFKGGVVSELRGGQTWEDLQGGKMK